LYYIVTHPTTGVKIPPTCGVFISRKTTGNTNVEMEEELICLDEIATKIRPDFIQNLDQLGKKSIYKISDCNISKIGIGYASI